MEAKKFTNEVGAPVAENENYLTAGREMNMEKASEKSVRTGISGAFF